MENIIQIIELVEHLKNFRAGWCCGEIYENRMKKAIRHAIKKIAPKHQEFFLEKLGMTKEELIAETDFGGCEQCNQKLTEDEVVYSLNYFGAYLCNGCLIKALD